MPDFAEFVARIRADDGELVAAVRNSKAEMNALAVVSATSLRNVKGQFTSVAKEAGLFGSAIAKQATEAGVQLRALARNYDLATTSSATFYANVRNSTNTLGTARGAIVILGSSISGLSGAAGTAGAVMAQFGHVLTSALFGPIGITIALVTAAVSIFKSYTDETQRMIDETNRLRKAAEDAATAIDEKFATALQNAKDKLREVSGNAGTGLQSLGAEKLFREGGSVEQVKEILDINKQISDIESARVRATEQASARRVLDEQKLSRLKQFQAEAEKRAQELQAIADKAHQDALSRASSFQARIEQRQSAAQSLLVQTGNAKSSDFIDDPFLKRIAQIGESLNSSSGESGGTGGSIGTRINRGNASARSVFGEQTIGSSIEKGNQLSKEQIAELKAINTQLAEFNQSVLFQSGGALRS